MYVGVHQSAGSHATASVLCFHFADILLSHAAIPNIDFVIEFIRQA
jgi:hypothetical protein